MKAEIIFDDWRQTGKTESIYSEELGIELSMGDLHSGTTWRGEINLPKDIEKEILEAMRDHQSYPVFRIVPDQE